MENSIFGLFKHEQLLSSNECFLEQGKMIDAISKDNQLRIQLESDERQKQLDNQMERDRLAEQRKFEDMKDNNRIRQLQVEGENRIKEAKLKGDIEANIKCLNNEA